MEPIAVVGDVHGDARCLRAMLRALEPEHRKLIFVGDYVNCGPESAEVVAILAKLSGSDPQRAVFIRGNHDAAFARYLDDADFARFASTGGLATLSSYLGVVTGDVHAELLSVLPRSHRAFLDALVPCFESRDLLVSHSGYDPSRPHARDADTMAHPHGWPIFGAATHPKGLVVCGHYVQRQGPLDEPQLICVDTGCGVLPDGHLTAVLLPERRFVTV